MQAWVTANDIAAQLPTNLPSWVDIDECCLGASELLYTLSGRQFTVGGQSICRPTRINQGCQTPWFWGSWGGWGGAWSIWPLSRMFPEGYGCGNSANEIVFPGPINSISQVMVNGVVLPPNQYQLYNGRRLVRLSPPQVPPVPNSDWPSWPCCQNLSAPADGDGSLQIIYKWGKPLPQPGITAAKFLAVEIAKAYANFETALPARVSSISRQGITAVVQDPLTYLEREWTGLPLVDLFLTTYNPFKLRRRGRVMSPDTISIDKTMNAQPPPAPESLTQMGPP